jgi:hypothetical protein
MLGVIFVRPEISFHAIGDEALLFDPSSERIVLLSSDQATAWCLLAEHGDPHKAALDLAAASGQTPADTRRWLDTAMAQWSEAGLLGQQAPHAAPAAQAPRPPPHPRCRARVLDIIAFDDPDDAAEAASLLAGFATQAPANLSVALIHEGEGCAVVVDGHVAERAPRRRQAIPALKLALVRLALSHAPGRTAVHAAALARNGRAVLLPAPAGSGKSTLAAACALAPGWELLSDDTAVFDDAWAVRPLPMAICLKSGAWPLLPAMGAATEALAVHERLDGRLARYLVAPRAASAPAPLAAVVTPRWGAGRAAGLAPLSKRAAMEALIPQLYPLGRAFDAALVEQIARLVDRTPCFALSYDAPADGSALLARVL